MVSITKDIRKYLQYQITAKARGYYDKSIATIFTEDNPSLDLGELTPYDGLKYTVDLSKNSVRPGEINFDETILPYVNTQKQSLLTTNYCFGNSGINYDLPIYNREYENIEINGNPTITDSEVSNFSNSNYIKFLRSKVTGNDEIIIKFKLNNTNSCSIFHSEYFIAVDISSNTLKAYNWSKGSYENILDSIETNKWYWIKAEITNITTRKYSISTDGEIYGEKLSTEDTSAVLTYSSYNYIYIGNSSYNTSNAMGGIIDLSGCQINSLDLNASFLVPNYKISKVGSVIIKDNILSNFDSNSYATIDDTLNLGTADYEIVIGFEVTQTNTKYQVLLNSNPIVYLVIAISPELLLHSNVGAGGDWTGGLTGNTKIELNKKYLAKVKRVSGIRYMYLSSDNGNTWSEENNIADTTSCDKTFRLGQNSAGTQVFTGGKIYLEGSYIKNDNFTYNLNAIKTESKPGIFYNYEDAGSAAELNCFSKSNEFVVLSPDENITDHTWLGKVNIPEHKISWGSN